MPEPHDAEFVARPRHGRVVTTRQRVGLGDTRPDGRTRLDALADFLQNVADEDAATSGVEDGRSVWILRRLTIAIDRTPRFRDALELHTWASGTGARWAERRTDVTCDGDVVARSVGVWVHVDRETGRPTPLPDAFDRVWGETAAGRAVRARLLHGAPPAGGDTPRERWPLRATDIDIVGHANNAAYWAAVEEELARRGTPRVARAEIEFRAGILPGDAVDVVFAGTDRGLMTWFVVGDEVRASALVHSEP